MAPISTAERPRSNPPLTSTKTGISLSTSSLPSSAHVSVSSTTPQRTAKDPITSTTTFRSTRDDSSLPPFTSVSATTKTSRVPQLTSSSIAPLSSSTALRTTTGTTHRPVASQSASLPPRTNSASPTTSAKQRSTRPTSVGPELTQSTGVVHHNQTTLVPPATQGQHGAPHPDTSSTNTRTIVAGVVVPLILIGVVALIIYIWYRRKYPVRMVIGKDFSKFSNPVYNKRTSTLTLVREDAEEEWERINTLSRKFPELPVFSEEPAGTENLAFEIGDHRNEEEEKEEFTDVSIEQDAEENVELEDHKIIQTIKRQRPKTKRAVLVKTEENDDFSESGFELVTAADIGDGGQTESEQSSGNDSTGTHTISLSFSETFDSKQNMLHDSSQNMEEKHIHENIPSELNPKCNTNSENDKSVKENRTGADISQEADVGSRNVETYEEKSGSEIAQIETTNVADDDANCLQEICEIGIPETKTRDSLNNLLEIGSFSSTETNNSLPSETMSQDQVDGTDNGETDLGSESFGESFEVVNQTESDESNVIVNEKVSNDRDVETENKSTEENFGTIDFFEGQGTVDRPISSSDTGEQLENDEVAENVLPEVKTDELISSGFGDLKDLSSVNANKREKSKSLDSLNNQHANVSAGKRMTLSNENIVLETIPLTPTTLVQEPIIFESDIASPVVLAKSNLSSPIRGRRAYTLNDIRFKTNERAQVADISGCIDGMEYISKSSPEIYGGEKCSDNPSTLKPSQFFDTKLENKIFDWSNVESASVQGTSTTENCAEENESTVKTDTFYTDNAVFIDTDSEIHAKEKLKVAERASENDGENGTTIAHDPEAEIAGSLQTEVNEDTDDNKGGQEDKTKHDQTTFDDEKVDFSPVVPNEKQSTDYESLGSGKISQDRQTGIEYLLRDGLNLSELGLPQNESPILDPAEYFDEETDNFSTSFLKSSTPTASGVEEPAENVKSEAELITDDSFLQVFDSSGSTQSESVRLACDQLSTSKKKLLPLSTDLSNFDNFGDNDSDDQSDASTQSCEEDLLQANEQNAESKLDEKRSVTNLTQSTDSSMTRSWEVISRELSHDSKVSNVSNLSGHGFDSASSQESLTDENNPFAFTFPDIKGSDAKCLPVAQPPVSSNEHPGDLSWDFISEEEEDC